MARKSSQTRAILTWGNDYSLRYYSSLRQIAGHFDGDGAAYVSIRKYTLAIRLAFYDAWKPQIESVKEFLELKGIPTRRLGLQRRENGELWNLTLGEHMLVRIVIRKLLRFACKKRGDLLVALNYLEDHITAKEAIEELNDLVNAKRRSGYIRKFDVPLKLSAGAKTGRQRGAAVGSRSVFVQVPGFIARKIRRDRGLGTTLDELHSRYGYTVRVIRRILGA